MTSYDWHPIDAGTYFSIRAQFGRDGLRPHATHTCMDGCPFHGRRHILTEWGVPDSDVPLVRMIVDGKDEDEEVTYWIVGKVRK